MSLAQTFLRHKVSLAASGSAFPRNDKLSASGSPKLYSKPSDPIIHSRPRCSCSSLNGNSSILKDGRRLYSKVEENERGVKLRNVDPNSELPSRSVKNPHHSRSCSPSGNCCNHKPLVVDEMYRNQGEDILEDGSHFESNTTEAHVYDGIVKRNDPYAQGINPVHLSNRHVPVEQEKPLSSAKNLESGGSVLRYALHLRFMCTPLRNSARERNAGEQAPAEACKVPPSGGNKGSEMKGDRRFYIYGDLRVVFPQRQSDSDEGKVSFHFLHAAGCD